jgi:hypothetical protein
MSRRSFSSVRRGASRSQMTGWSRLRRRQPGIESEASTPHWRRRRRRQRADNRFGCFVAKSAFIRLLFSFVFKTLPLYVYSFYLIKL